MPATPARPASRTTTIAAASASAFAATLMLIAGVFQFIEGLIAVVNGNEFFVSTPNYIFRLNATSWGWLHLVLGLLVAVAGGFIFTGNRAARGVGMALAAFSAVANFLWLPYYPLWSIVVIALDVFIIWGLAKIDLDQI
jgi:hypothetical protein